MKKRQGAKIAAVVTAALTVPIALGTTRVQADEVLDLRTNQELLQQRVDQLAQARVPGNLFGVGGPPGPVNVQMTGGSFPRSFLIPGTDTSIRVGGEIRLAEPVLDHRRQPGPPIDEHQCRHHRAAEQYPADRHARPNSSNADKPGARSGRLRHVAAAVEAECRDAHPDRLGRGAQLYRIRLRRRQRDLESRPLSTSNSLIPRLRYAYGTLGRCCSARPTRTSTIPTPAWKAFSSAV